MQTMTHSYLPGYLWTLLLPGVKLMKLDLYYLYRRQNDGKAI